VKRKTHSSKEKANLVLEVLRAERTVNEIAAENNIHPSMLFKWKKIAMEGLPELFSNDVGDKRKLRKEHEQEVSELYKQIGKLTTQMEWLKKKSGIID